MKAFTYKRTPVACVSTRERSRSYLLGQQPMINQTPTIVFMDLICLYLFKCNLKLVCKTIKSNKPDKSNLFFDTNEDVSICISDSYISDMF